MRTSSTISTAGPIVRSFSPRNHPNRRRPERPDHLEAGRKRNLGRGGFGECEYAAAAQERVNVLGQLLRTRDFEPMKSIGCHDGVVVAGQTVLPAMNPQVGNNNLAGNLIPPIHGSADRS